MTVQIQNSLEFKSRRFTITNSSSFPIFNPIDFDLKPINTSTCCWSGFYCHFVLDHNELILRSLHINLDIPAIDSPSFNGIKPIGSDAQIPLFTHIYNEINLHVPFSGGLLVAKDFLEKECGTKRYNLAWNYEHCYELVFDNGVLIRNQDVSEFMAAVRARENYIIPRKSWWKRIFRKRPEITADNPELTRNDLHFSYGSSLDKYRS